jgi:hypothetical protein
MTIGPLVKPIITHLDPLFRAIPEVGSPDEAIAGAYDAFAGEVAVLRSTWQHAQKLGYYDDLINLAWLTLDDAIKTLVTRTDEALWHGGIAEWDALQDTINALEFIASHPAIAEYTYEAWGA